MVTVPQADSILQEKFRILSFPARSFESAATGCVLREHVVADRDLPPFDRATMDGIAVNSASFLKGVRQFPVEGLQKAGAPALSLKSRNACLEIATGAVLPKGCDCVIPVEYVEMDGRVARCSDEFKARPMFNVHRKGSDARKGGYPAAGGVPSLTAKSPLPPPSGNPESSSRKRPRSPLLERVMSLWKSTVRSNHFRSVARTPALWPRDWP